MNTNNSLSNAIIRGNTATIRRYLNTGGDPVRLRTYSNIQESLLHIAAQKNKVDIITMLLDAGADPNVVNNIGETPLFDAVNGDHLAAVKVLLKRGANPAWADADEGNRPLHHAVEENYVDIARALLAAGAPVDAVNTQDGQTALVIASDQGHADMVKLLLTKGANPDRPIVPGYNREEGPLLHPTALHVAAYQGYPDVVAALIRGGARVDAKSHDGRTPLLEAVARFHNLHRRTGKSPIRNRFLQVVEKLVTAGARIDVTPNNSTRRLSLIHRAVVPAPGLFLYNASLVGILLRGASPDQVNVKDADGNTALHYAANLTDFISRQEPPKIAVTGVVLFLVHAGARLNARNNKQQTPLHFASMRPNLAQTSRVRESMLQHRGNIISFMIQRGANVNAKDIDGNTPLHFSVSHLNNWVHRGSVIRALLLHNANPFIKNNRGQIPLDLVDSDAEKKAISTWLSERAARRVASERGLSQRVPSNVSKRIMSMTGLSHIDEYGRSLEGRVKKKVTGTKRPTSTRPTSKKRNRSNNAPPSKRVKR
jgi:ankyrin repeat protein